MNPIKTATQTTASMTAPPSAARKLVDANDERISAYLSDESKLRGSGLKEIVFPKSPEEVCLVLGENFRLGIPTRVSGARSGLAGAAVPEKEESVLSLEEMTSIGIPSFDETTSSWTVRVQPGVTLRELNHFLFQWGKGWYFPVDPTETAASIGGMAATNASGARTYFFGPTRNWIRAARIALPDGNEICLQRGRDRLDGNTLQIEWSGALRSLLLTPLSRPPTKATLGYWFETGGDVLDLFIGAEGTLGVFTEIELALAQAPAHRLSYMQFFSSDETALRFVERLRASALSGLLAIEFLDRHSLELALANARGSKSAPAALVSGETQAAIYIEVVFENEPDLLEVYAKLEEILSELGTSSENSYAGIEERELREIKAFRHAVPEQINSLIAQRKSKVAGLHKIATDMAVPDSELMPIYRLYRDELLREGMEFAIFGHAGNNHFHVNILPRDGAELIKAKELYRKFAEAVVRVGGAVAAEHGIGRLKREFLALQYAPESLAKLREIKDFFDPRSLLNNGVLFGNAK